MNLQWSVNAAKFLKANIVRSRGVGEDLCPMLELWWSPTRFLGMVALGRGIAPSFIHELAVAILAHQPDGVVLIAESFGTTHTDDPRGLVQRFSEGDPTVKECLLLSASSTDGSHDYRFVPYRYDGRTVIWEDDPGLLPPKGTPLEIVPGANETMEMALRRCGEIADHREALDLFESYGLVLYPGGLQRPLGKETESHGHDESS